MGTAVVQPNSASGTLTTPPTLQGAAIALRAQGKSKRKIAEELGIHRNTVSKILAAYQSDELCTAEKIQKRLVPLAIARIEQVLPSDTDTARWTLEHTLFRPVEGDTYRFDGDATLNQVVQLLPGVPNTPPPGTDSSTGPTVAADPSSQKAPGTDVGLSLHTNFSQFSAADLGQLAQLVAEELARRKTYGTPDAQTIPAEDSLPAQAQRRLAEVSGAGAEIIEAEVVP